MPRADQIVAIGASAGGIEPLQDFFDAMPPDSGMAFVVVQHLSPDHPSLMHELLSRHTSMSVRRVADGMEVEADTVYVIPPKTYMRVENGQLRLTEQQRKRDVPPTPIDVFFESVAAEYAERGAAVVLSGTGTDGSRGIQAVAKAGGRTIAQDGTAKFDGMPRAAIDTGVVDMILPPGEMPALLTGDEDEAGVRPSIVSPSATVIEVLEVLRDRHGIDFSQYKLTTVLRRIERRVQLTHAGSVSQYLERLRQDSMEQDRLYRDLLIGVTRFFRDEQAFELLDTRVIETLLKDNAESDESLRIWIAGCATGEEAYSVAMLVHETAVRLGLPPSIRIFATDAHRGSIEFASVGRYPADQVEALPEKFKETYFSNLGDTYQVGQTLRGMITFAPHNILADAPFTRMDLVICRNMLIYFKPAAQQRALSLLHFALRVDGALMLGSSETVGRFSDEFVPIDSHWRIYRKRRDVRLLMDGEISGITPRMGLTSRVPAPPPAAGVVADARVQKAYDEILTEVLPAGMLLNGRRELVHTFGRARDLLRPPRGRVSLDVLDMVDPAVRVPMSAAIVRATREKRAFRYENVGMEIDGETRQRVLEAKPISVAPDSPPYVLVTITDPPVEVAPNGDGAGALTEPFKPDELSAQKISALEHELQHAKENLQATVEEMETTNEELNATNEELIASNEELQSTNEELQSVNEELHTVNAEHQQKITELTKLTDDMDNLMSSTNIGTLFLDPEMLVRKFTPAATNYFRLREQDVGRPLDEVTGHLDIPDLLERARAVFGAGKAQEFEANPQGSAPVLVTLSPYRTRRGFVDGVVVSLVDIRAMKETERLARSLAEQNQTILDHIPALVWYKDRDSRIIRANRAAAEATGLSVEEMEGQRTEDLYPADGPGYVLDDRVVIRTGRPRLGVIEPFRGEDSEVRWIRTDKVPMFDDEGAVTGLLVVTADITELRNAQKTAQDVNKRLEFSLAAAKQGTWECNLLTGEASVDDHWLAVAGHARENTNVVSVKMWAGLIHPSDRNAVLDGLQAIAEGESELLDVLCRIRSDDGSEKWVRFVGSGIEYDDDGAAVRLGGTIADADDLVTAQQNLERMNERLEQLCEERTFELKVSQDRFERAIVGAQKGVWEWVIGTEDCWYSDVFWELLGHTDADRPPGKLASINERIHPEDFDATWEVINVAVGSGEPFSCEYRLRGADDAYRWFRVRGVPGVDPDHDRAVLSGSIMDIHDWKLAERELVGAKRELEARVAARTQELSSNLAELADRNEQLDQFAHVASHDLRAPLRTIAGNAELALMSESGKDEHLQKILSGTRRINALIDGLTAYSRVGRQELSATEVDLDDLVAGLEADLENDITARGAAIEADALGVVRADPALLKQVLQNLIANAIKFVRDREPRVEIWRVDRPAETVIRVADNGIGIDPAYTTSVFDPFQRLNAGSEFAGSGIGLTICQRAIQRHGGEIWVEPNPGGGSVFSFTLPAPVQPVQPEQADVQEPEG